MDLKYTKAKTQSDIQNIVDYNIKAFSDSPDFEWDYDQIKKEVDDGWELYAVYLGNEIIAAVFLRVDGETLETKNTAIKMMHQGSGYSHKIKEFFEEMAKEKDLKHIVHYCRIDNFRMYSLNESHGYHKSDRKLGEQGHVVEWIKHV